MKLERIRIHELPGIRPGFAVDELAPGINLLVGPNASGKSSVVRALRYLVCDGRPGDPPTLHLEATLCGDDGSWRVLRTGNGIAWQRDGAPAEPPPLPERRFFHCYWLTAEQLLQAEYEGDREIVERLRRELTGGYDLDALVAREGPFGIGPRHGQTQANAFRDARKKVRKILREYEDLHRQRRRLPELDRRIAEGADVRVRIGQVERALELLEARRERLAAEAAMAELPADPAEMALLRGDELTRLDDLQRRRHESEEERRGWAERRQAAADELVATGLADRAPEPEELELRTRDLQRARELLRDRSAAVEGRDTAAAEARVAAERLGAPGDALPRLDPDTVSDAEELAVEIQRYRQRLHELEARVEDAPDVPDPARGDSLRTAVSALRDWLAAGSGDLRKLTLGAVATAAAVLLALVASMLDAGLGEPVAVAALVIAGAGALGLTAVAWRIRHQRSAARDRFPDLGIDAPRTWAPGVVASRLEELQATLVELQETESRARRSEADRERLERASRELGELEQRKHELADRIGFDPERTATSLHEFVSLVGKLDDARRRVAEADLEIKRIDDRLRGRFETVRAFLGQWREGAVEESGEADVDSLPDGSFAGADVEITLETRETALARLSRRCKTAEGARRTIAEAERNLARLDEDLQRLERREGEMFREAGLEGGDRTTLATRLEALGDFEDRREKLRDARTVESRRRSRLEGKAELLAAVDADDESELRAELERIGREAEELEGLKKRRTQLATVLEKAGADRKLEQAKAELQEARDALERARDEGLRAAAGRFLVEDLQREHRAEHEPALLRAARDRFERFTHNRWTLELEEGPALAARDVELDERRSLEDLSSATRMQLLLAVRVAWTRGLEGPDGEPFPLFLDEALTTSDPERYAVAVESLASLVEQDGRQIFYLCAQPSEVQLWERALGDAPHVVDLGELRFGARRAGPDVDFSLPERRDIPPPADDDPEAYAAQLRVPPIDPWDNPQSIHPFHLLRDDLDLLHRLVADWRIEALGPLETLLGGSAADEAVPGGDTQRRLRRRCQTARRWIDAWRDGRGRPVDRAALLACDVVTDTYIEELAELAEEVGGDARQLAERAGEISGWGAVKVGRLSECLEAHGHLDDGPALDRAGRESRVIREMAGSAEPAEVRQVVAWVEAAVREWEPRPG